MPYERISTFGGKLACRSFQIDLFLCKNALLSLVCSLTHSLAHINRAICLTSRVNFFALFLSFPLPFVLCASVCLTFKQVCDVHFFRCIFLLLYTSVIIICGFGASSISHFDTPSLFILLCIQPYSSFSPFSCLSFHFKSF